MFRRRLIYPLVVICLVLAAPALASRGSGGNGSATIAFANGSAAAPNGWPSAGASLGFAVTANVKASDLYNLWVANRCTQNGTLVYAQDAPVYNGYSGAFSLNWANGGAASCTAYVWLFPDSGSPLRGGSMTYSVSG